MRRSPAATVPVSSLRTRARAPRAALVVSAVVLSVAGLRSMLASPSPIIATPRATPVVSVAMLGLAESFARDFLTSAGQDADQATAVRLDGDAAAPVAGHRERQVILWSAPVAARVTSARSAVVTVAVRLGPETTYLAVPIRRTVEGRLSVPNAPAVVGPPSLDRRGTSAPELEVEDQALKVVAARVVRHYLESNATDLAADLDRGATVSLPRTALRVADIEATTWVAKPSRIAVHLIARGQRGQQLALRYELAVARVGGRWLVRSVHVNPLDREVAP